MPKQFFRRCLLVVVLIPFANLTVAEEPRTILPATTAGRHFPDYRAIRHERFVNHVACGPLSLLAVCDHLQVALDAAQRDEVLALAGETGTDLLTLKKRAQKLGLSAVGVRATPEELRGFGLPAIVHLSSTGFAAVTGYGKGAFLVTHPAKNPLWETDADFAKRFGERGIALLLSRTPIDVESLGLKAEVPQVYEGPHLEFEYSMIAVGRIHAARWEKSIKVFNRGRLPLQIATVESSCSCIEASIAETTIAPASGADLVVRGNHDRYGRFVQRLAVASNDPDQPVAEIRVSGYREPAVLFPEPALLVKILEGEPWTQDVEFELPTGAKLDEYHAWCQPADAPIVVSLHPGDGGSSPRIRLAASAGALTQNVRLEVKVKRKDAAAGDEGVLHVGIEVQPRLEVFPLRLRLRAEELGAMWTRRIKVSAAAKEELESLTCRWSDEVFEEVIAVRIDPSDAKSDRFERIVVLEAKEPDTCRVLAGRAGVLEIRSSIVHGCVTVSCEE